MKEDVRKKLEAIKAEDDRKEELRKAAD